MQFEKLLEYEKEAMLCPNYQYKDTPMEQLLERAFKSFNRLPDLDKKKVIESWNKYCDEQKLLPEKVERHKNLIWFRFLAQTNLFFLCKLLEKYNKVTMRTHEEICNAFFVPKDPTFFTFEEFAKDYHGLKERMLLVPRGGFKSSIDIADCAQWIICFPEITILILTGVYGLAKDFVGELRTHFLLMDSGMIGVDDKPAYVPRIMQDGTQSLFQVLFAEHCTKDEGKETEFNTPANKFPDKEPTVMAAGIEQSLSGWHFGIMKLDDVVTNENSQTVTRLESVNRQIEINAAMLRPFGFFDIIGTWYDEQDYYGIKIKYEEQYAKEEGLEGLLKGSPFEGVFNSSINTLIYLRAAWWPTEEAKKLGKIEEEMVEQDWVLWFPEELPYAFLRKKKGQDPATFAIKYENNPRKVHQVKFPRELLVRRTIPASQLPSQGMFVTTVDTAYSTKNWADYTVIMTSMIAGGKFFIVDMVRGRFNEYELPAMIAQAGYKWKPKRIAIEDSVGVRWMAREIRREMDKLAISIPLDFVSLGFGSKAKSKEIKAKPVVRLLGDERLFFANSCQGLPDIYNELEKFNGEEQGHDDIISALSILAEQFAAFADMDAKINYVQTSYIADKQSQIKHDMIYGLGSFAKYNQNSMIDDNPVTQYQINKMQSNDAPEIDPLQELF